MTETLTGAQLLRAAAEKLRRLAAAATPGPWEIEYTYGGTAPQAIFRMDPQYPGDPDQAVSLGVMEDNPADNAWVATVHPGVAGPLAELLDTAASHEPQRTAPDMEPYGCVKCGGSDGAGACDTWLDGLAVARMIVGEPCEQAGREPIESLIERSSLGTPEAKAARESVPEDTARAFADRVRTWEPDVAVVRRVADVIERMREDGGSPSTRIARAVLAQLPRPAPADRSEAPSRDDVAIALHDAFFTPPGEATLGMDLWRHTADGLIERGWLAVRDEGGQEPIRDAATHSMGADDWYGEQREWRRPAGTEGERGC